MQMFLYRVLLRGTGIISTGRIPLYVLTVIYFTVNSLFNNTTYNFALSSEYWTLFIRLNPEGKI